MQHMKLIFQCHREAVLAVVMTYRVTYTWMHHLQGCVGILCWHLMCEQQSIRTFEHFNVKSLCMVPMWRQREGNWRHRRTPSALLGSSRCWTLQPHLLANNTEWRCPHHCLPCTCRVHPGFIVISYPLAMSNSIQPHTHRETCALLSLGL